MKSPSSKYIIGFAIRFILGTLLTLCAISATRLLLTNRTINKATKLLNDSKPETAIEELQTANIWTPAYPSQARRIDYLMIHASLMQKDRNTALKHAAALPTHVPRTLAETPSPWEKSLIYPDMAANYLIAEYLPDWNKTTEQARALLRDSAGKEPFVRQRSTNKRESLGTRQSTGDTKLSHNHISNIDNNTLSDMPDMPDMPDTDDTDLTQHIETKPEHPTFDTATTEWGLTISPKTTVYSTKGKKQGLIPAGTIINITKHKNSPQGDLVICSIMLNGGIRQAIIRRNDTILYKGDFNAITDMQYKLCIQHAKLLGQISSRENQLKTNSSGNNPYASKYRRELANYKAVVKKNNALLKAYNDATGARRMQIADKLRLAKHDAKSKSKNYTEIKKQYTNWEKQNSATNIDFSKDSQIKNLKQKVAAIEKQLANP